MGQDLDFARLSKTAALVARDERGRATGFIECPAADQQAARRFAGKLTLSLEKMLCLSDHPFVMQVYRKGRYGPAPTYGNPILQNAFLQMIKEPIGFGEEARGYVENWLEDVRRTSGLDHSDVLRFADALFTCRDIYAAADRQRAQSMRTHLGPAVR